MLFTQALQALKQEQLNVDIINAVLTATPDELAELYSAAYQARLKIFGKKVFLRGLIEFSNHCSNLCHYCGINAANIEQLRYRLSSDEILECAKIGSQLGYHTLVLQAGEDPIATHRLEDIIISIKEKYPHMAITLSAGMQSYDTYKKWRLAGADRYLMRFETSNRELFAKVRPGTTLDERLQALEWLRDLGYQVGTGHLIGLPRQTNADLAADIMLLYKIRPDMIGIGPFIPHPATPLAAYPHGSIDTTLTELAILRLALPYVLLPATTALGSLQSDAPLRALSYGANVIMPNISPPALRKLYAIYPNKAGSLEDVSATHERILNLINKADLTADFSRGDSLLATYRQTDTQHHAPSESSH